MKKVELKKISNNKSEKELAGYDGYVLGAPTYHRAVPGLGGGIASSMLEINSKT
jgi:hypothetical protein